MNILIACEESQIECLAFRARGHNCFSCDIQDTSGSHPEWHIKCDVLKVLNPLEGFISFHTCDNELHIIPKWDLIIAHPPCTYLAKSGARWLFPCGCLDSARFELGKRAREFFMALYNADCEKICIENPVPIEIFGLPTESQHIQPFYFGEPFSKLTYLWLKGLPPLMATLIVYDYKSYVFSHSSSKLRSKSFLGIAQAMAEQWG